MKISTKGRYGLRALIDLTIHSENGHVSLNSIAERQNISLNYLEQAFSALKKNGLIKSVKGAQGGYILADSPENITVYRILSVLEGDLSIVDEADPENLIQRSIKQNIWDKIDASVHGIFNSLSLRDLAEDYRKAREKNEPMYYI
jgi:Rrf2 family cysteine metabolism transcriptional repressor